MVAAAAAAQELQGAAHMQEEAAVQVLLSLDTQTLIQPLRQLQVRQLLQLLVALESINLLVLAP